jgi:hypothetical protein
MTDMTVSQVRVRIEFTYANYVYVRRLFCMETSGTSGLKKRLFHRKSIATINVIEHVLLDANSYLAYCYLLTTTFFNRVQIKIVKIIIS